MFSKLLRLLLVLAGLLCFPACETSRRDGYQYESIPWSDRVGDDMERSQIEGDND